MPQYIETAKYGCEIGTARGTVLCPELSVRLGRTPKVIVQLVEQMKSGLEV